MEKVVAADKKAVLGDFSIVEGLLQQGRDELEAEINRRAKGAD